MKQMKSVIKMQQISSHTSLNYFNEDNKTLAKKAEKLIKSLTGSFLTEANDFIKEMDSMLEEAALLGKSERYDLFKTRFFQLAHDLKGQGTTYGFELITVLADQICTIIRHKKVFTQKEIDIFAMDIQDMQKVLSQGANETTPQLKKQILNRLEQIKCLK
jgi:chemotaxis protein histidine kinase CheA